MPNYQKAGTRNVAPLLKALSNPHRLGLFLRLVQDCKKGGTCCGEDELQSCVGELGRNLRIAPSTVSHHLKELRQAGLIRMERQGQRIGCYVDQQVLARLAAFFSRLAPDGGSLVAKAGTVRKRGRDRKNERQDR